MYFLRWQTTLDWSVHDHMKSSTITARGFSFLFQVMIQSHFLHTEDFRALSVQHNLGELYLIPADE